MRPRIRFNGERGASAEGITLFDLTSAEILRVNLRLDHLHLMAVPKAYRYLGAFARYGKDPGEARPARGDFRDDDLSQRSSRPLWALGMGAIFKPKNIAG